MNLLYKVSENIILHHLQLNKITMRFIHINNDVPLTAKRKGDEDANKLKSITRER